MKYYSPASIEEATSLLTQYGGAAKILAGGTDVITHWRAGETYPAAVIDVSKIPDLHAVTVTEKLVTIGAAVTFQEIVDSKLLQEAAPLLVQACAQVGVWQVRNRGTIGGNIANASPVADSVPALLCLDAEIQVSSVAQTYRRALATLFRGPGRTDLLPQELITSINFTAQAKSEIFFYQKLGQRRAQCIAKVSVGFRAACHEHTLRECRMFLGAVGPTVLRATQAEALLNGQRLTDRLLHQTMWAAAEDSTPITDLRSERSYRHDMVAALVYKNLKPLLNESEPECLV